MKIPNDSEITSETNTCQIQDQKTETPKISSTTTKISSNNQTSVEPTELAKPRLHSNQSYGISQHFKFNNSMSSVQYFSMQFSEFKKQVSKIRSKNGTPVQREIFANL